MAEQISDEKLLEALRKATMRELTAKEIHDQTVSFVMGTLKQDSGVTRARVEELLARQKGQGKE